MWAGDGDQGNIGVLAKRVAKARRLANCRITDETVPKQLAALLGELALISELRIESSDERPPAVRSDDEKPRRLLVFQSANCRSIVGVE
ncbi:hypothetical protein [Neorhizobium sp. DT-125]|uniref:hypothetical protein n=1 Tax=Neorhizobium sp. DT-125 TaxID=3396163 RepID=UPI003F1AEAFD